MVLKSDLPLQSGLTQARVGCGVKCLVKNSEISSRSELSQYSRLGAPNSTAALVWAGAVFETLEHVSQMV